MTAFASSSDRSDSPGVAQRIPNWLWIAVVAMLIAAPPLVTSRIFFLHLGVLICLNAIIVFGLFLVSRTGQLSLCHAAFVGLGAYTSTLTAITFGVSPLLGMLLAAVVTGLTAFVIGAMTLKLRGVYFVLVTFLFGQVFNLILLDAGHITRGANGIVGIPSISLFGFPLSNPIRFYPFAATMAVLAFLGVRALLRGPAGRALDSVEENILLAESSGIDTQRYQQLAFTLGSMIAGIGGALFAHYIHFISPESFTFWDSVTYIVMLVVGGRGNIYGALTGVLLMTPLPELLRSAEAFQHILYGAILVLILKFLPDGLIASGRLWRQRRERSAR